MEALFIVIPDENIHQQDRENEKKAEEEDLEER